MTFWAIFGWGLLAFTVWWLAYYIGLSYESNGGAIGMLPVLGGAIHPPVYATIAIAMITHGRLHWWYALIWVIIVIAAYHAIGYAADLGTKTSIAHGRRRYPSSPETADTPDEE
ncbi:MAG: hypothetical protein JWQ02_2200 [Capsulimonas sp.]|jgi:hypothetical protein|nr:hypothetical protein [Capsulimonas sp.]